MNVFSKVGIELIENPKIETVGYENVDTDAALLEAAAAYESVIELSYDLQILENAYEAIEESLELDAELIAKDKYTPEVAQIGYEAFAANLKILGVDPSVLGVAGFESADDSKKAKEGFLAKAWEGIKAAAKKVWEAILKFIRKITDFVMGLFGKRASNGEKLKQLLEKLEKEGKTVLPKDAKFDEKTAKTLASHVFMVCEVGGSADAKGVIKFLDTQREVLAKAEATVTGMGKSLVEDLKVVTKLDDVKSAVELKKYILNSYKLLANNAVALPKELESYVKEIAVKQYNGKDVVIQNVLLTTDNAKFSGLVLLEDQKVIEDEISKTLGSVQGPEDISKVNEEVKKVFEKIKTFNVEINFANEYGKKLIEKCEKAIKPISFDEAKQIADKLVATAKERSDKLKTINKQVEELKKNLDKALSDLTKDTSVIKATVIKFILSRFINGIAKDIATGAARGTADLAKSKVAMIVVESSKLWTKAGEEKKEENKEG